MIQKYLKFVATMILFLTTNALAFTQLETSNRVEVTEEKVGKVKGLRIRIFGSSAEKICGLLGEKIASKSSGYIVHIKGSSDRTRENQEKTCLRAGSNKASESGFGFILLPDQTTLNLESQEYK